jgi:hypothetical protein
MISSTENASSDQTVDENAEVRLEPGKQPPGSKPALGSHLCAPAPQ